MMDLLEILIDVLGSDFDLIEAASVILESYFLVDATSVLQVSGCRLSGPTFTKLMTQGLWSSIDGSILASAQKRFTSIPQISGCFHRVTHTTIAVRAMGRCNCNQWTLRGDA